MLHFLTNGLTIRNKDKSMWKDPIKDEPELNEFVIVICEHWHTKGRRPCIMQRVDEDDVDWRFEDGSEPSYDWTPILWMPIPDYKG